MQLYLWILIILLYEYFFGFILSLKYHGHLGYVLYNLGKQGEGIEYLIATTKMIEATSAEERSAWTNDQIHGKINNIFELMI